MVLHNGVLGLNTLNGSWIPKIPWFSHELAAGCQGGCGKGLGDMDRFLAMEHTSC